MLRPIRLFDTLTLLTTGIGMLVSAGCSGLASGTISESRFQQIHGDSHLSRFVELDLPGSAPMRVHYQDEGKGPPLLLLHGIGDSLLTWDRWTEELKADFRIVRVDYPPFGLTPPFEQGAVNERQWIEFLDAFLDRLNISSAYVAGNSLGGGIAWRYAAERPSRVKKLVLLDPAGFIDQPGELPFEIRVAGHPVGALILRRTMPRLAWRRTVKELYLGDWKADFRSGEEKDRYRIDLRRFHDLSRLAGHRNDYVSMFQFALELAETETDGQLAERIGSIQAPVLLLWGANDPWFPPNLADQLGHTNLQKWRKTLPDSKIVVYEGTGHMPQLQIPEESARDARQFLLAD